MDLPERKLETQAQFNQHELSEVFAVVALLLLAELDLYAVEAIARKNSKVK